MMVRPAPSGAGLLLVVVMRPVIRGWFAVCVNSVLFSPKHDILIELVSDESDKYLFVSLAYAFYLCQRLQHTN